MMDVFSTAVRENILRDYPEWRGLVQEGDGKLLLEVPVPPAADMLRPLIIYTSEAQIVISCDHYRASFGEWLVKNDVPGDAAAPFVKKLLSEDLAILSVWDNIAWRGSVPVIAAAIPDKPEFPYSYNRVRIRSWRGTYNKDYAV